MKSAGLENAPSLIETPAAPGLHAIRGGQDIPYAALVELRHVSNFGKRRGNIEDKMPDIWLSQTPTLIEAAHQNIGNKWSSAQSLGPRMVEFVDIDVRDMHDELNDRRAKKLQPHFEVPGGVEEGGGHGTSITISHIH